MEEVMQYISNNAFAMVIATYVIVEVNKTLKSNNEIITKLVEKIDTMQTNLENHNNN